MNLKNIFISVFFVLFSLGNMNAQESDMGSPDNHPRIYGNKTIQNSFEESIESIEWKKTIVEGKTENIEKYLELCKQQPDWLLSRLQMNWLTKHDKVFLRGGNFSYSEGEAPVPTVRFSGTRDWATDYRSVPLEELQPYFDDERGLFLKHNKTGEMEWVHPAKSGHIIEGINAKIMALVEDAAFLYWLTGEKKYAEFAAPVYETYMKGMYYREAPLDLDNSNQQRLSGLATFEVIHEKIVVSLAVTYDFMYDYLKKNGHEMDISVTVFQRWADIIIKNGVPDNNWNFFQARFLTYIALALDNDENYENGKGQQYYLEQTFDLTSERQIGLKEAVRVYDQENGMWPECASYSMHVTSALLKILTLLDNVTNADEFQNFPIVEKATLASFQYLFPNGQVVGFGDSHHNPIPSETFEMLITNYRKYNKLADEEQITALYKSLSPEEKRGRGLFELFFYVDELAEIRLENKDVFIEALTSPTFYAPNVSWFVQRMGTGDNATMVSTVGAFGNHAHANGIAIEMYANNQVIAPEMGRGPSYWHEDHRNYYSRYPAHNTVVVDGKSDSDAMRVYHPFKMENHFPKSGDNNNTFEQVTFSNVSFVEPVTKTNQQRFTAIIKGVCGKPYVLDIFRSAKTDFEKQKHEYFYHNLGQSLTFFNEKDEEISLTTSNDLNAPGNLKAYEYFSEEKSIKTSKNVKAEFQLETKENPVSLMKVWVKGGEDQQYFSVKGQNSRALSKETTPAEVLNEKIPAIVIRKNSEAWNKPFVCVFNPYLEGADKVISDVKFMETESNVATQVLEIIHTNGTTKDLITVNTSENDIVEEDDFYLKGLLAIKRETADKLDFMFAAGVTRCLFNGWEIVSIGEPLTTSIEKCEKGFVIQNDKAVKFGVPKKLNPDYVEIYSEGQLVEKRHGIESRRFPDRVDFSFEKAFEKAILVLKK